MLELISIIVFFLLISAYIIKERDEIEVYKKIIIIRRWKKGRKKIEKFAKKHERLLTYMGNLAVIVAVLASAFGIYYLLNATLQGQQAFGIVLPSVSGVQYPKPAIAIPFWYWIVGIFTILVVHETMHALLAAKEKVKIKNYGIILLLIFPIGAFVEPDEKKLKKLKGLAKQRILAAGSFANIILALILLAIGYLLANSLFVESGAQIVGLVNNTPAMRTNLSGTIIMIENYTIKDVKSLANVLSKLEPGQTVNIITTEGNYSVKLADKNGSAYLGVIVETKLELKEMYKPFDYVITHLMTLISWLFLLNLGVGIVNVLPIKPLDGGLMFEEFLKSKIGKKAEKISTMVSVLILALIIANFASGYLVFPKLLFS